MTRTLAAVLQQRLHCSSLLRQPRCPLPSSRHQAPRPCATFAGAQRVTRTEPRAGLGELGGARRGAGRLSLPAPRDRFASRQPGLGEARRGSARLAEQNPAGHAWRAEKPCGPRVASSRVPAGHAWPAGFALRATRGPHQRLVQSPCGPRVAAAKTVRATRPRRVASGQSVLRSHGVFGVSFSGVLADSPRFLVF